VHRFAKEFNSEVNVRYALWKRGYQSQSKDLPGLLELEEQALKAYLSVLFAQYLSGHDEKGLHHNLFSRCNKVIRDYCLKHSELLSISEQEPQLKSSNEPSEALARMRPTELKKHLELLSLTIHSVILQNLEKIDDATLHQLGKGELGQLLIDLTICDDRLVRQKNHMILSRLFEQFQAQS
jgi:brefeldin A-inhibited guanine nucleotide-exchange protein